MHIAVDDAGSSILAGHFCKQETLEGYFEITHQIYMTYGIPGTFYTDKRTVFEYMTQKMQTKARTQFNNACHKLGIEVIATSVPEAKGRVERVFRTLQDRLVNEMALQGITTIDEANKFLPEYIKRYNAKYSILVNTSSFKPLDETTEKNLNTILATYEVRSVLNGGLISYCSKQYMPVKTNGQALTLPVDTKIQVVRTFDKRLLMLHKDVFHEIKHFANGRYTAHTPPTTHPWKRWRG